MKNDKCKNCDIELWVDEEDICEFCCEENINTEVIEYTV